jgi:leucyl aminopeptidase
VFFSLGIIANKVGFTALISLFCSMKAEIFLANDAKSFASTKLPANIAEFWNQKPTETFFHYYGPEGCFIGVVNKGKSNAAEWEVLRKAACKSFALLSKDIEKVVVKNVNCDAAKGLAFFEGLLLSDYQFDKYLKKKSREAAIEYALKGKGEDRQDEIKIIVAAVNSARDLVNEPVNALNAQGLADAFVNMGEAAGFKVEVFGEAQIESLKMGGLLAVNKGSQEPPTFSVLEYKPKKAVNSQPIVLVGKGVVFDTGGLSLKPTPNSMDMMKCDMGGAAVVAGVFEAVAKLKWPLWIIGLVPSTDNRPGENATCPGDVITMFDGTTVEVLNTDAEGRLILGDALSFAKKFDPQLVIDYATLTGAAARAFGTYGSALMAQAPDSVVKSLKKAGDVVFERVAEMPLWEEYYEEIKGGIADIKNLGKGEGGAQSAAMFLRHFTQYPWVHIDIAGTAFSTSPSHYIPKGGTGVGVRLTLEFLRQQING